MACRAVADRGLKNPSSGFRDQWLWFVGGSHTLSHRMSLKPRSNAKLYSPVANTEPDLLPHSLGCPPSRISNLKLLMADPPGDLHAMRSLSRHASHVMLPMLPICHQSDRRHPVGLDRTRRDRGLVTPPGATRTSVRPLLRCFGEQRRSTGEDEPTGTYRPTFLGLG